MDSSDPAGGNPFSQVPVEVTSCVGKAHPKVRDLLSLEPQSVLLLDKTVDDPVELYVGQRLIARGVLEEEEGQTPARLIARLTEVAQADGSL